MQVTLIFPHQLFTLNQLDFLKETYHVYVIEEPLFFKDKYHPINFHKQKLVLHRASMKSYEQKLIKEKIEVTYIEHVDDYKKAYNRIKVNKNDELHIIDPVDFLLRKRLKKYFQGYKIVWHETPNFLLKHKDLKTYEEVTKRPFFHDSFYKWQRKELNLLINKDGNPTGGKWSFDLENREKLTKNVKVPEIGKLNSKESNDFIEEAKEYIKKSFPKSIGVDEEFNYPINHSEANKAFEIFLKERFENFGPYEDAVSKNHSTLFHSVLTPYLNIGLITPEEILEYLKIKSIHGKTIRLEFENLTIPINSYEGFLRQIIGWREFMRFVYERKGVEQRKSNFFKNKNKINERFYSGTTRIVPIDDLINQLNKTAYAHHIPRLMFLGNFFLLCDVDPEEVYKWFMEYFIDAYDWVMVPNIFGMSQYSDGGKIVTKPYISGSSYIKKMSDYNGKDKSAENELDSTWAEIWDGLFWRFMKKNSELMRNNPRMNMLLKNLESHNTKEKIKIAEKYLSELFLIS